MYTFLKRIPRLLLWDKSCQMVIWTCMWIQWNLSYESLVVWGNAIMSLMSFHVIRFQLRRQIAFSGKTSWNLLVALLDKIHTGDACVTYHLSKSKYITIGLTTSLWCISNLNKKSLEAYLQQNNSNSSYHSSFRRLGKCQKATCNIAHSQQKRVKNSQ